MVVEEGEVGVVSEEAGASLAGDLSEDSEFFESCDETVRGGKGHADDGCHVVDVDERPFEEALLKLRWRRHVPLGRPVLPEQLARPPLRHRMTRAR